MTDLQSGGQPRTEIGLPLTEVTRHYRRAVFISAGLGVVGLVVTGVLGHVGVGMLLCVGLGLGATNGALVQVSTAKYSLRSEPDKRRFALGVLGRLSVVTVVALFFAIAFRPEGLAVIFGLAIFQLLMLAASSVAMLRTLRNEGPPG
jgi:drug/metabolite transporter (DMT)-like permease